MMIWRLRLVANCCLNEVCSSSVYSNRALNAGQSPASARISSALRTVAGRPFYFRARGNTWEFTVAERDRDDPAGLGEGDVTAGRAWYRSGTLPGRFDASWMPIVDATSLINECARAYVNEKARRE